MQTEAVGDQRQRAWLDRPDVSIPLLLVLALALRLPNVGRSLWYDEVIYSTHYQARDWQALFHFVMYGPFAPVYPVIAFLWTGLVGEREILVRTPSLICGLASIALVYQIGRRLSTERIAFLAALMLCLSPVHVWYSQEATPYMAGVAFLLGAIATWPLVAQSPVPGRWDAIYATALLAAVLTHFYVAVFLAPLTLMAVSASGAGRRRLLAINAGVAVALACVIAAKYWHGALTADRGFLRPFTAFEWWMLFFNWFLHGNSLWTVGPFRASVSYLLRQPVLLAVQMAAALLVLSGVLPGGRAAGRAAAAWELGAYLVVLPAAVWALTAFGYRQLYVERYLIFALPFFAIALATGAARFRTPRLAEALALMLVLVGVSSYAMYLRKPTTWTVYKHNPDWQSAVRYLRAEPVTTDPVVVFAAVPIDDLKYYLRRDLRGRHADARPFEQADFDRIVAAQHTGPIYLVNNLYWSGEFDQVLARAQRDERIRLTRVESFPGVALYTFAPAK